MKTSFASNVCLIAGLSLSGLAQAQPFNYFQIGLSTIAFDDVVNVPVSGGYVQYEGAAGINLRSAFSLNEQVFLFIDSRSGGNEGYGTELNLSASDMGIGLVGGDKNIAFYGKVGFSFSEVEACYSGICAKAEGDGFVFGAGAHVEVTPSIAILADISQRSMDYTMPGNIELGSEVDQSFSLGIEAGSRQHKAVIENTIYSDFSILDISYRYNF